MNSAILTGERPRLRLRWRLLDLLIVLLLLACIALFGMVARSWPTMTVQAVRVHGDFHALRRDELSGLLASAVRGDFWQVDLSRVQAAALSSPWVESARVTRVWPDSIDVDIHERRPVALWGQHAYISSQGQIFTPSEVHLIAGLPLLYGPADQALYVMAQYRAMNAILAQVELHITELELTEGMSWRLRLDDGLELRVDAHDTLDKLQRFVVLYRHELAARVGQIHAVDLRYSNGIAVAWNKN